MVKRETYKAYALSALQDAAVQEELSELVAEYWFEFHEVFITATVCNSGVRPENITNEMYSCLHHVVRGLGLGPKYFPVDEIKKAKISHIKRGTLDSYKISINSVLKEDDVLLGILDFILLADDLAGDFKEKIFEIKKVRELQANTKEYYKQAKILEAKGKFAEAIEAYNTALNAGLLMKLSLKKLYDGPIYTSFIAREGKHREDKRKEKDERKKERGEDQRYAKKWSIFAAIITGIIVGSITTGYYYFRDMSLNQNNSATTRNTAKQPSTSTVPQQPILTPKNKP